VAKKKTTKDGVKHRDSAAAARQKAGLKPPWKPGESGNPNGPPRAKIQLFRYICLYLEMTPAQLKRIDQNKLTMSQLAAIKTVMKMANQGEWQRVKEMIDRETRDKTGADELVKLIIEYVDQGKQKTI